MQKIIFSKPSQKVLEFDIGKILVKLIVKPLFVSQQTKIDSELIKIQKNYSAGKIPLEEYYSKRLKFLTNDFKNEYFNFLELAQVDLIIEKLKELQKTKPLDEIKNSRVSKFRLLKLMRFGFTYDQIEKMETTELDDWLEAENALSVDEQLKLMNIAVHPHTGKKQTINFNKLAVKQEMSLGNNPFIDANKKHREKK